MAAGPSPKSIRNNDDFRVANLVPLLYNGKAKAIGGRLAQRLERLVHTEEAGGSNPPSPTIEGNLMLSLPQPWGRPPGRGGETADALRSGRSVLYGRVGSNPSLGTNPFRKETGRGPHPDPAGRFQEQGKLPRIPCACSSVERALPCGGRGRGFESRQARHFFANG